MAFFNFTISEADAGLRLDKFLARELPQYSRSFLTKCKLLVNGEEMKQAKKLQAGDSIEVKVPALKSLEIQPENIPLQILHEDSEILVVNKPAGMVTHPTDFGGNVTGTLVNALLYHCRDLDLPGEKFRPGLVHRLDKDTSGVMVIAKTEAAKASLTKQFSNREVEKIYLALLIGNLKTEKGRIEAPIGRDLADRKRRVVSREADAREAITEFEIEEKFYDATLVKVKLLTGRTHQIRVHFTSIGYPVVGDKTYGFHKTNLSLKPPRMFLHAYKLAFTHPKTGEKVSFSAPLPGELSEYLLRLRMGK